MYKVPCVLLISAYVSLSMYFKVNLPIHAWLPFELGLHLVVLSGLITFITLEALREFASRLTKEDRCCVTYDYSMVHAVIVLQTTSMLRLSDMTIRKLKIANADIIVPVALQLGIYISILISQVIYKFYGNRISMLKEYDTHDTSEPLSIEVSER